MTHIVIGYPNIGECFSLITEMVNAGVDIIELQLPTLNAHLDGTTIRNANTHAIANGIDADACFSISANLSRTFPIPFVFVTYYETVQKYGPKHFFHNASNSGIDAIIIPDIPYNLAGYLQTLASMSGTSIVPVIFPESSTSLFGSIPSHTEFCYCALHGGTTGESTLYTRPLLDYLQTLKQSITPPLAAGFGIKTKHHVDFLKGYADIAVIGSQIMQIAESEGIVKAGKYLRDINFG